MALLSKGIKLSYATTSAGTYTEITNLQEVPNMGGSVDKVEITTLANEAHTYIAGLKDYGDMDFKFLFDNSDATSNYRVCKSLEGSNVYWKVEFPDKPAGGSSTNGTTFTFEGQPSVSVDSQGAGVATTFTLSIAVSSDITVANPA